MVVADADTDSWIELGSSLADEDVARLDALAAVLFDAETLTVAFAPVS